MIFRKDGDPVCNIRRKRYGKTEAVLHALCPDSVNWKSGKMLNGYDRAQMEAWVRTLA